MTAPIQTPYTDEGRLNSKRAGSINPAAVLLLKQHIKKANSKYSCLC